MDTGMRWIVPRCSCSLSSRRQELASCSIRSNMLDTTCRAATSSRLGPSLTWEWLFAPSGCCCVTFSGIRVWVLHLQLTLLLVELHLMDSQVVIGHNYYVPFVRARGGKLSNQRWWAGGLYSTWRWPGGMTAMPKTCEMTLPFVSKWWLLS